MILPLVYAPDPSFRKICEPVLEIDDNIRKFCSDFIETLRYEDAIGLAAPHVKVHKRIVVIDCGDDDVYEENRKSNPIIMINPVIIRRCEERVLKQEGSVSYPGIYFEVERARDIEVEYMDLDGVVKHIRATGLRSRCIQHEMDHLDGIVFSDYLSKLKQSMVLKKAEKIKKRMA